VKILSLANSAYYGYRSEWRSAESPAVRYADVIINSSRRAGQLPRQLLSLSRKDPISFRVISVNNAIRITGKLLGETLDRRIRLEYDLTEEHTNVKADETQIEQVLLNLSTRETRYLKVEQSDSQRAVKQPTLLCASATPVRGSNAKCCPRFSILSSPQRTNPKALGWD
jgi:nitrogen fixation/metabolism regulation signal transduction histidine kinase